MRKWHIVPSLILSLLLVAAIVLPGKEVRAADTQMTDTYYYDHIPQQAQKFYRWLKDYYDKETREPGTYYHDFTSWLPADPTEAQVEQLCRDLIAADASLKADDPLYQWKGRVSGWGYNMEEKPFKLSVTIDAFDLLTPDIQKRVDARIQQIVNTVGTADRYTQLRKLTDYLITTSFYDPYLDQINGSGNHNFATRGHHYNQSVYGLLLEGIAVCDGFSQTVKLLCNELDIPCIIMGNASHGWNLVQMDDGKWYRLDLTNVVSVGWDADLSESLDMYFEQTFLRNDTLQADFGVYDNPYMINMVGHHYVEEFPEHADGQYQYTGSTTDFSYTVAASTYTPGSPKFCYRVNADGKTCTITNYEGKESGDLTIPGKLDGYTVTAIDAYAFYYCTGFTGKLTIPDSVEVIGRGAFAGCYALTSVKLPANLREIKNGAFIGCKGIGEVLIPDLVDTLEDYAFYDCNNLRTVTFGSHIQAVGNGAFDKIADGAVLKAPAGSAAQNSAAQSGLTFQATGSLCAFQDADGQWEFDNDRHFHTCQHGARFDFAGHTSESGVFNCGDMCTVCKAEACTFNGMMKSAWTLINETPATCVSPAYSGDWQCVCGNMVKFGTYYGEPTGQHVAKDGHWEYNDDEHWHLCECGQWLDVGGHTGGTATATQQAKCSVCGAAYGPLKEEQATQPAATTAPTQATQPAATTAPTQATQPAATTAPTQATQLAATTAPTQATQPAATTAPTQATQPVSTAPATQPAQQGTTLPSTEPSQPETSIDGNAPEEQPSGGAVWLIFLVVVLVAAGGALGFWMYQKKKK